MGGTCKFVKVNYSCRLYARVMRSNCVQSARSNESGRSSAFGGCLPSQLVEVAFGFATLRGCVSAAPGNRTVAVKGRGLRSDIS